MGPTLFVIEPRLLEPFDRLADAESRPPNKVGAAPGERLAGAGLHASALAVNEPQRDLGHGRPSWTSGGFVGRQGHGAYRVDSRCGWSGDCQ